LRYATAADPADSTDVDVNMPGFDVNELRRLLNARGIRAVYQPVVDLRSLEPVAYEALARGPSGSPLESPERLFATAGAAGLLPEVDGACRAAAIDGAVRSTRTDPFTLFVNVEPGSIDGTPLFEPPQQEIILRDRVRVVVELTERALTARPADLLAAVGWLRSRGVGVALDDVGVDRRSLALMPFVRPDVIKLDMRLVQDAPSARTAAIANAVWAEAERSGAQVLAEGIETDEHLQRAIALGATLGQGWLFGRPDELPEAPARRAVLKARRPPSGQALGTPFRIVARKRELRRATKPILLERSRQLEAQVEQLGPEAVLLSSFQEARFFSRATWENYRLLAERAALVGAFGHGMADEPAPGVRGGAFEASDSLCDEWNVIVLSPHFAAAFVARDLRDDAADEERRFDFAMTYDRDVVVAAASSLMSKVVPQLGPTPDLPSWMTPAAELASRA
jgi:EAL domain-containing protein (putative c-di-GMP-specific phosphodiesterase class I)